MKKIIILGTKQSFVPNRHVFHTALLTKRKRRVLAFRVSGDGRWWKERQAEGGGTSNMFILFRKREQRVTELMRENKYNSSAA